MSLNFRQFLYVSVLVLIVLFGVSQCSKQIFIPYLSKQTVSESRSLYQKTQEERVRNNVDSVLHKLLGEGTYDVSVVMNFKEEYVQENTVKRDPKNASETSTEEESKEFQMMRAEALDDRPSTEIMHRAVAEQHGKLPGMIDLRSKRIASNDLPGFPVLPDASETPISTLPDKPSLDDIKRPIVQPEMNPDEKNTNSYKKKSEQSRLYYNETVTQTTRPGNRIEKVMVNVVVDSDQMKLLDLSRNDLERVISDVASINPSRGDELNVSFFPFIEKSFGVQQFYAKNKKTLNYLGHIIDKLRWVILGGLSLIIFGGIAFLIYGLFRKKMDERNRILEEDKARRLEDEKLRVKEKLDAIEEKRKAVGSLAHSKPADVATLILNWIEAYEGEEGKKNVPGA